MAQQLNISQPNPYAYAIFTSNHTKVVTGGWHDICTFAHTLDQAKTYCDSAIEDGADWAHAVCLNTWTIHVDCRAYDINKHFTHYADDEDY
jgi:hypothetical protein